MDQEALPGLPRAALSGSFLRRALAWTGALSALTMIVFASNGQPAFVTTAAMMFALMAVAVALIFGWQAVHWPRSGNAPLLPAFVALLQSSTFAAICYAWGAVAMQGVHFTPITGLKWQHGWQYALAMALLAAASMVFARSLSTPLRSARPSGAERQFRWATPLAAAQAGVAGVGLAALVLSGKIFSSRADWAANRVFAALAIAILALSVASIVAQRRLRPGPHPG